MKIGFVGLPCSGKTTIFNALTHSKAEVGAYANSKAQPNVAVVQVKDERITRLTQIYHPKKTTYATIEIVDFAGLTKGSARNDNFFSTQMTFARNLNAIALVARNFDDDLTGAPAPLADIETIDTECILSDMIITENRLERIAWSTRRGKKTNAMQLEEKALQKILEELNCGRHVRDLTLNPSEQKLVSGFQFLTHKPFFVILNSGEKEFGHNQDLLAEIEAKYRVIEFAGKFEMELAAFDNSEEAGLFMAEMGIAESAQRSIRTFAGALSALSASLTTT